MIIVSRGANLIQNKIVRVNNVLWEYNLRVCFAVPICLHAELGAHRGSWVNANLSSARFLPGAAARVRQMLGVCFTGCMKEDL